MQVTPIKTKKGKTLIEWTDTNGTLQRSYVPAESVEGSEAKHPERGLAYGVDWGAMVGEIKIDPALITKELRQSGIWTADDLAANLPTALAAVCRAQGVVMQTIISKAQNSEPSPEA